MPSTGTAQAGTSSENPLRRLSQLGQAVWLDYMRRSLVTSGELERLIREDGLSGVTSNPTIFEKAVAGTAEYDASLAAALAAEARQTPQELFWKLALEDIVLAADTLRPVWERTGGRDGFVSLEVSPELARDPAGTIAEARRLWQQVGRPNLMIKVPATTEGLAAIEALTAEGINVNVTLIFTLEQYERVVQAFLRGLERAERPERVASVASVFISRVDTAVDRALEAIGSPEALALRGTIAIAAARRIYRRFRELFAGEAFEPLRRRGAGLQRLLWASTSTKNPAYRDVLYVEELIGPDTINTMPPATLAAFREHGRVRGATIEENLPEALERLKQLERLGIALDALGEQLQKEGVEAFAISWKRLLETVATRRERLLKARVDRQTIQPGALTQHVAARLEQWGREDVGRRLWARDYRLWSPTPQPEITDRLGWLELPEQMHEEAAALRQFAEQIRSEGMTAVVLLGMGGSSLAPEVFAQVLGPASGFPRLLVLDSTHPAAIRAVERSVDLARTLFIVSSKSGTTIETLSFFRYFWHRLGNAAQRGRQFVAITDPGTPLETLARERGFRQVFRARPDVGGRYSALSHFGLVPAALLGIDVHRLLDRAWEMAEACAFCVPVAENPALQLGALLGEAALAGRDKLTFAGSPRLGPLGTWLEQLVAESTGKDGRGIVPVEGEPLAPAHAYGSDRIFVWFELAGETLQDVAVRDLAGAGYPVVRVCLSDLYDLAQEFFRWEMAVAAAGSVLGIHPFNQPDVQLAKDLARRAMQGSGSLTGEDDLTAVADDETLREEFARWAAGLEPGQYIALQAYLQPEPAVTAALQQLRLRLRDRFRVATTLGYGPRFLHSTGQLHKGGPASGRFLQLVDDAQPDVPVPETDFSFGQLIRAQARGDAEALRQRGRQVLRVNLGSDALAGLRQLESVLDG